MQVMIFLSSFMLEEAVHHGPRVSLTILLGNAKNARFWLLFYSQPRPFLRVVFAASNLEELSNISPQKETQAYSKRNRFPKPKHPSCNTNLLHVRISTLLPAGLWGTGYRQEAQPAGCAVNNKVLISAKT